MGRFPKLGDGWIPLCGTHFTDVNGHKVWSSLTAARAEDGIGVVASWDRDSSGDWKLTSWGCTEDHGPEQLEEDPIEDTPPFLDALGESTARVYRCGLSKPTPVAFRGKYVVFFPAGNGFEFVGGTMGRLDGESYLSRSILFSDPSGELLERLQQGWHPTPWVALDARVPTKDMIHLLWAEVTP